MYSRYKFYHAVRAQPHDSEDEEKEEDSYSVAKSLRGKLLTAQLVSYRRAMIQGGELTGGLTQVVCGESRRSIKRPSDPVE